MVPVRDRLLPAFAACVGEAFGALAPSGDCATVPSAGRSISSGSIPGFDVAVEVRLGAGLALGDGSPDCVGTVVAFGSATDGARPVAPGTEAELGCGAGFSDGAVLGCVLGTCVGSAEGLAVGSCVGSAAGADDVSDAGALLGSGAELGSGAGAASALGAAHTAGVMHRDVKPANILLDSYGSPRLSDFGIASVQREGQDPTVTLECLTPDFAAPEAFMLTSPGPDGDRTLQGVLHTGIDRSEACPRSSDPSMPPSTSVTRTFPRSFFLC